MKTTNKKGFTLIELLVVITIIGILATGATATYTSQIQKARDTTRVNDVKALESGIQQSYQDVSEYPKGGNLKDELVKYMGGKIPGDSKNGQPCNGSGATNTDCGYAYIVNDDDNGIQFGEFELSTAFENKGNVDTKSAKDGGNDSLRLELGNDTSNSTAIAKDSIGATQKGITKIDGTTAGDKDLVVINGNG